MPIYRIIQSNSNRTAACVQSTFFASSNDEALSKLNKYNDSYHNIFSYLWLEIYNELTHTYDIIKNTDNNNNNNNNSS